MKKGLITVALLLLTVGFGFSLSMETNKLHEIPVPIFGKESDTGGGTIKLYGLHEIAGPIFDRESDTLDRTKFWGGGFSFSTINPHNSFGFFVSLNVLYYTESEIIDKDGNTISSVPGYQNYDLPISLDMLQDFSAAPKFLFFTIPISIGVHMAFEWNEPEALSLRLRIDGRVGIEFLGLFAGVQVSYDFFQWDLNDSGGTDKNANYLSL